MGPVSCSYYVTASCNAQCDFCDIWRGPAREKPRLAPLEQCARILAGLRKLGVRYVDFTGGEPLLVPELPELLHMAKGLGLRTGLVSNGYLYPSRAAELKGLVSSLSFSLDSADRQRHNGSRKLECYDRVLESIEIARRGKQLVNINFSVGNHNLEEIPGMVALARELQVVVYVMPVFSYFGNPALDREHVTALRRLFGKPYVSLNLAALKFLEEGGNQPEKPKCRAMGANIAISPDGNYLLPCFHAAVERMPVGDNLVEQWRSPEMASHRRRAGRYEFCRGCTIWCYLSPSFLYRPDKYFALQAYSSLCTGAKLGVLRMRGAGRAVES